MSDDESIYMVRPVVPNTSSLKASIIEAAEDLPQHIEFSRSPVQPQKRWRPSFMVGLPIAACGIIALVIFTNSSVISPNNIETDAALVISDDLDWQEMMLLEDEWLLADL
jgi:hypothetical protein